MDRYGNITSVDLKANEARINEALENSRAIDVFFQRIDDAVQYADCKSAVPLRITLEEMGHVQPPTPVQIDNTTTEGIMNSTMQQKRSKAMDMRFYWVQDRIKQNHLKEFWKPGNTNLGDYHTKHHAPNHHSNVREHYIHFPGITRQASTRVC